MATKDKDVSGKKPEGKAAKDAASSQDAKRKPFHVLREEDVSASVWLRHVVYKGRNLTFYSATFERYYKDASGTSRYTGNFDYDDLPKLVTVAQRAAEYIRDLQESDAAQSKAIVTPQQ